MAGPTDVLTAALLIVPLVLLGSAQLPSRARFIPAGLMLLATALHFESPAQVFAGEAGRMLALLLGFSVGIARLEGREAQRWAALCWVLLLGWETPAAAFAHTVDTTGLEALMGWAHLVLGFAIGPWGLQVLCRIDRATRLEIGFGLLIGLNLIAMGLAVGWMLAGLLGHHVVSLRVHADRGQATRRRWMGLMRTYFHSVFILVLGTVWVADQAGAVIDLADAAWEVRHAVGFVLLCGLAGSLLPTLGIDARPRPEAWGFHMGMLVAPALLPGIAHIEHTLLSILLLVTTTPVLATHPEFRPDLPWRRRGLESLLIVGGQIVVILCFEWWMLLGLLAIPFLQRKPVPAAEEE